MKKPGLFVAVLVGFVLLAPGCEVAVTPAATQTPVRTPTDTAYPTLTIFAPIGSSQMVDLLMASSASPELPYDLRVLEGPSTVAGVRGLMDGAFDLTILMRAPRPDEPITFLKLMEGAIAVFVDPALGITNLTHDQVRGLFSGEVTNWSQLGGPDQTVRLFVQADSDPVTDTMRQYFEVAFPASAQIVKGEFAIFSIVGSVPGAVGYGGWTGKRYLEVTSSAQIVDAVTLDGLGPEDAGYPVLSPVGLAYLAENEDFLNPFVDWTVAFARSSLVRPVLDLFGVRLALAVEDGS